MTECIDAVDVMRPAFPSGTGYMNTYDKWEVKRIPRRCHRLVYQECFGPIDDGKVIMHTCDNRRCVNPEHLRVGTQRENVEDCFRKGRGNPSRQCGELNGEAKLTDEKVIDIRKRAGRGEMQKLLAVEFRISESQVSNIVRRKKWASI